MNINTEQIYCDEKHHDVSIVAVIVVRHGNNTPFVEPFLPVSPPLN